MACNVYFDTLSSHQFVTEPWSGRSTKRDRAFALVKKRGQERRILVSPYGEVLTSDIPLYQALIMAGYAEIAVVVVVGQAKPADIKAAKAFSAKHPLTCIEDGALHSDEGHPVAFRKYAEYVEQTRNR